MSQSEKLHGSPRPTASAEAVTLTDEQREELRIAVLVSKDARNTGVVSLRCSTLLALAGTLPAPPPEAPVAEPGAYGIIDPDYARIFTIARTIAWQEGYAIAMHGSFTRDLDLLAVPWTEAACDPGHLMRRIAAATGTTPQQNLPHAKPHDRLAWCLLLPGFSEPRFVDLSITPRAVAPPEAAPVAEPVAKIMQHGGWREAALFANGKTLPVGTLLYAGAKAEAAREPLQALTDEQIMEYGALCVMNSRRKITAREALAEYRQSLSEPTTPGTRP